MTFGKSSQEKEDTIVKELRSFSKGSTSNSQSSATTTSTSASISTALSAFLGQGTKVSGTLNFDGPVELDGFVEGEIVTNEKLTIGENAVINAKISGSEIVVLGTVNGDISASKLLALKKPAKLVGNISCSNLSIEEGVVFEGQSNMAKSPAATVSDSATSVGDEVGASA